MERDFKTGFICLSDIPKELIRKAENGKLYLSISIGNSIDKETGAIRVDDKGNDYWLSCSPKKEEQKEGVNYFIGKLKTYKPQPSVQSAADVQASPVAAQEDVDNLPF